MPGLTFLSFVVQFISMFISLFYADSYVTHIPFNFENAYITLFVLIIASHTA